MVNDTTRVMLNELLLRLLWRVRVWLLRPR